jgi:hypothetical protein
VTKPSSGLSLRLAFVGWEMALMVLSTLCNGILVRHFLYQIVTL